MPNTKRPDAPSVRYVIPIYSRTLTPNKITRKGGALRVYLERPWWSSGGEERLGVVCWHRGGSSSVLPPATSAPYVTLWGFDPVYKSTTSLPGQPTPSCFPLTTAASSDGTLTIEESADHVDVAGHDVGFDASRNLWYCDIRVSGPDGKELASYLPFIRLALVRYQPHSIANAHLSKVVIVDYAQLAPNRFVTMTGSGNAQRSVTVSGRAAVGTAHNPTTPSVMQVTVEARDTRIDDDALAWSPVERAAGGQARDQRQFRRRSHVERHRCVADRRRHASAATDLRGVRTGQRWRRPRPARVHREHHARSEHVAR